MWLGLYVRLDPIQHELRETITSIAYTYSDELCWHCPDTLVLEIQKSAQLHYSLHDLVIQLLNDLSLLNLPLTHGIAPNPTAASLLAKHNIECWNQDELVNCLDHWHIQVMPLETRTKNDLLACGLTTLGALKKQSKDQRIRRFGQCLNDNIAQLYGEILLPTYYWKPQQHYYQRIEFIHPLTHLSSLERYMEVALNDLAQWLKQRDVVTSQIDFRLKHEKNLIRTPDFLLNISLAEPGFNKKHIQQLIHLKLETIRISEPLATLIIECKHIHHHEPTHNDLFNQHSHGQSWSHLLDRLTMKLGQDALFSLAACAEHQPEKSWQQMPPNQTKKIVDSRSRPAWIMEEPTSYHRGQLTLEDGPERIETGWWESQACQRDYWIARDQHGRRLWVFREHRPRTGWFIHGIFG